MQEPLGLERSLGEGNDNPLWYSCLGNPMDREACWATIHGSQKQLSNRAQPLFNSRQRDSEMPAERHVEGQDEYWPPKTLTK